jgi:hypothetical protein
VKPSRIAPLTIRRTEMMGSETGDELTPSGVTTRISILAAFAPKLAGIDAVRRVASTNVVSIATPFHSTAVPGVKPLPFTVRTNAALEATRVGGVRLLMTGIGLIANAAGSDVT